MRELKKGYLEFKKSFKEYQELFKELIEKGQHPKSFFITCSDSRIVPHLITNSKPGDLFVSRNIGNFVPPFSKEAEFSSAASALEYAVEVLKVENIIVCSHSDCGAIASLFKDIKPSISNINIRKWLSLGEEVKEKTIKDMPKAPLDEKREYAQKISAIFQIKNLLTYPFVEERVKKNTLKLYAWYYNIEEGEILVYSFKDKRYIPLEEFDE